MQKLMQHNQPRNMAGIICNKGVSVIHCGLKILVLTKDHEQIHEIPAPVIKVTNNSDDSKKNKEELSQQQLEAGLSCAAAAVSPAGDKVAVCDDRKQVCIFNIPDLRSVPFTMMHDTATQGS